MKRISYLLVVLVAAVQSQIVQRPMNALKKVNDSVTLECRTNTSNCAEIEWAKQEGEQSPNVVYKDGRGMLNGQNYPPARYSVNPNGGCSLTINQLAINDSGKFMCTHRGGGGEETKNALLVVINVTDSCRSNFSGAEFVKDDVYSFWSTINTPAKSVEPSNVTLSFQDMIGGEKATTDWTQLPTVKTILNGTVMQDNVTSHLCRASFTPRAEANLDGTIGTLEICHTQPLIVQHRVGNIAVSPPAPHCQDNTVRCTADGYPLPIFQWKRSSGEILNGDTLTITGDVGDSYTCTATNTVKGSETSLTITITVSPASDCGASCGGGCAAGIVCGVIIFIVACLAVVWYFLVYKKKKAGLGNGKEILPLHTGAPSDPKKPPTSSAPEKPPRASGDPLPLA